MSKLVNMVPVDTLTSAELRVLNNTDVGDKSEWVTPEFVSLVGTVAVNLLTAATVLGWLDTQSAQEVTKAVTTIITAIGAISVNGIVVWKYLAGRAQVKSEQIVAQYRYAEAIGTARIDAEAVRLHSTAVGTTNAD